MSEKLSNKPENNEQDPSALERTRHEQNERLKENRERKAEHSQEQSVEAARHEVLEHATANEKLKESERKVEKRPSRPHKRTKKLLDQSFTKQMKEARQEMSAPSRSFSKFIHVTPIEAASEAIGTTIARPNAILAGSLSAFLLVSAVYLVAKYIGYPLSGFETIGAFILGWLIGIMIDFFRIMATGKR